MYEIMAKLVVTKDDFNNAFIPKEAVQGYQTLILPKNTILFRGKKRKDEEVQDGSIFMADFEHTKEYMNIGQNAVDDGSDRYTFENNVVRSRCNMFQAKRNLTLFALNPANLTRLRSVYPTGSPQYKALTAYTGLGSTRPLCFSSVSDKFPDKEENEVVVCPTYTLEEYAAAERYADEEIATHEPTTDEERLQARKRYRIQTINRKLKEIGGDYLAPRIGAILKALGFEGWVWLPETLKSYWSNKPYIRTDLHEVLVWDWTEKFTKLDVPCYTMDPNGDENTELDVESVTSVLNGGPPTRQKSLLTERRLKSLKQELDELYTDIRRITDGLRYDKHLYIQGDEEADTVWIARLTKLVPTKSQFIKNVIGKPLAKYNKAMQEYESLSSQGGRRRKVTRRSRKLKKGTRKIR
jgi:hypothetical protein